MLAAQEGAGAAHAGLHLVHDEDEVLFVAEGADSLHILGVQRHNTALALYQFQHDSAGVAVHHLGQGVDVAGLDVLEALVEGAEVVVEHALSGGGQGSNGTAMEAVDQRDDVVAVSTVFVEAVLAGGLDGALVGLCARVAEEHPAHAGALAELFGQLAAGGGIVEVGGVLQLVCLPGDGLGPGHIAVAQAVDADAAGEVEVLLPLGAFGIEAVALLEDDGVACVGMQDILVVPLDDFFGIHNIYLLTVEPHTFPLCQRLPYKGSWREAPERSYEGEPSREPQRG